MEGRFVSSQHNCHFHDQQPRGKAWKDLPVTSEGPTLAGRRRNRIDRHTFAELALYDTIDVQRRVCELTDANDDDTGCNRYSAADVVQGLCKQCDIWIVGIAIQDLPVNVRGDETHCDRCRKTQRTVENGGQHHHARYGTRCISDLTKGKCWNFMNVQEYTYLFRHVSGTVNACESRRRGELAEHYCCTHRRPSTPIFEFPKYFSGGYLGRKDPDRNMELSMSTNVACSEHNVILTPNQRIMCKYRIIPSNIGNLRAANVLKAVASNAMKMVIKVTCLDA
jgi:hypothetical protein